MLRKVIPEINLEIPRLQLRPQSTGVHTPKLRVSRRIRATRGGGNLLIPGVYPLQELLNCAGGPREKCVIWFRWADDGPEVNFCDDDSEVTDYFGVLEPIGYMSTSKHGDHDDAYRWKTVVR